MLISRLHFPSPKCRGALVSIACCVSVFLLSACSGSNTHRTLLNYVPSTSYAVLAVNWKTVRLDPELKRISRGSDVEKLFTQLGLDEATISEFAVFGEATRSAEASNGLIAKGTFDSAETLQQLEQRGWTRQDFEGRRVYVNPQDLSWLTTFDKNLLVVGTQAGVKDAIGAKEKSVNRFTANPSYKTLSSRFEGKQYPILMMVALPQASQDMAHAAVELTATVMDLAGAGPLGDLLNKIGYAKAFGCAISHKNDSFPMVVSAVMKDEESARIVTGALALLKGIGGMVNKNYASSTDADAARAIQSMSIDRSREVISIKLTMSNKDLEAMSAR